MTSFHPDFLGETARRIGLTPYPNTVQLVVQHLYPDTLRLLLIMHRYVPILRVIGIGYSGDDEVVEQLRAEGVAVETPEYAELGDAVDRALDACLAHCERNRQKLLLHEVGGYAIDCLHKRHCDRIATVVGAIEVTKQGVWVAEQLPELLIPQLNCAQTRLKQIEGKMVGESVVTALDVILRELGYSVVGRQALVLGYGWVGRGTANSLQDRGMQVSVFDSDILTRVEATVDGFAVPADPLQAIAPAVVIGVSGHCSVDAALLDSLPDRCFIASGASKDHEIDLAHLRKTAVASVQIHRHVEAYELRDGRTVFLVNRGFPVNFTGSSVPDEIVEFLFSELLMLVPMLLDEPPPPGLYPLPQEQERIAAQVWLDLR